MFNSFTYLFNSFTDKCVRICIIWWLFLTCRTCASIVPFGSFFPPLSFFISTNLCTYGRRNAFFCLSERDAVSFFFLTCKLLRPLCCCFAVVVSPLLFRHCSFLSFCYLFPWLALERTCILISRKCTRIYVHISQVPNFFFHFSNFWLAHYCLSDSILGFQNRFSTSKHMS